MINVSDYSLVPDGSSDFNFGGGLAGQDVTKVGAGLRAIQVGRPGLVAPVSGRWTEAVGSCAPPCPGFVSPEPPGPANHIIVRLDGA